MLNIVESMSYKASVEQVAKLYADPAYGRTRAHSFGSDQADVDVRGNAEDGFTTVSTVKAPTAMIPVKYRKFVGDSITVVETQKWEPVNGGTSWAGTMAIEIKGAPVHFGGTFSLDSVDSLHSELTIDAELSVKIPLVGKQLENAASQQLGKVFALEEKNANTELAKR